MAFPDFFKEGQAIVPDDTIANLSPEESARLFHCNSCWCHKRFELKLYSAVIYYSRILHLSGRMDSNHRPLGPEPSTLPLRYYPNTSSEEYIL